MFRKNTLSKKDIERISIKQKKEQAKRDKFESHIEVYMVEGMKYPHYALLRPRWPKLAPKKCAYYQLTYYPVDRDMILAAEGSVSNTEHGGHFDTYNEFKRFLKTGKLREVSEFEWSMLKGNARFRGHFEVTDVESIELSEEDAANLDEIFTRSRCKTGKDVSIRPFDV